MDIEYVEVSQINELKEDSEYFIVGINCFDAYIFKDGPYLTKYFKLPFSESNINAGSLKVPHKTDLGEAIKEMIHNEEIYPLCFNDETIKDYNFISAFVIYVTIYTYSKTKKRPFICATTEVSVICDPNKFDPKDKTTYKIKSNNRIIEKSAPHPIKYDNNPNVEDYGEE